MRLQRTAHVRNRALRMATFERVAGGADKHSGRSGGTVLDGRDDALRIKVAVREHTADLLGEQRCID